MSFGQATINAVRFRFDKESIRMRDVSAFRRWLDGMPAGSTFDLEFEPSEPGMHLLECSNMRRFAGPLLAVIEEPFLRLDGDGLPAMILASLSELLIVRAGEMVTAFFPIDSLQSFFLAASHGIQNSPTAETQFDRMLLVSARLGMNDEDWLDSDSE